MLQSSNHFKKALCNKMLLLLNAMSDLSALHLTYKCPSNTILPQIMARVFISFQQLFTPATKRDWRLYEIGVY